MSDDLVFEGFPIPTRNFFSLPNEMINIIARITNLAELKVIIYVIRHTWGFHEYGISKVISTDEFMHGRWRQDGTRMDKGTGLSNRSVIDGLRAAEEHGYLICDVDTSDRARTVKSYKLKMIGSAYEDTSQGEESSQGVDASYTPLKKVHRPSEDTSYQREGSSHRSEKDTIERHYRKTPKEREDDSVAANADNTPSFLSPAIRNTNIEPSQANSSLGEGTSETSHLETLPACSPTSALDRGEQVSQTLSLQDDVEVPLESVAQEPLAYQANGSVKGTFTDTQQGAGLFSVLQDATSSDASQETTTGKATNGMTEAARQTTATKVNGTNVQRSPTMKKASSLKETKETRENKKDLYEMLTIQEKVFWGLWANIDQHHKVKPILKKAALAHIHDLVDHVTTQEQMDSLVKFTRQKVSEQLEREIWKLELGNLRYWFADWDRQQQPSYTPSQNGHSHNGHNGQKKPNPADRLPTYVAAADGRGIRMVKS